MATIKASPFKLALVQLGQVGKDKTRNLAHAREMVLKAAEGAEGQGKVDVVVLPEVFNSPYAVSSFRTYAESIPSIDAFGTATLSESISMMSAVAKEAGVWLVGGSIPELEETTDSIFNTCTVYNPSGELVAVHRKVHLFDIDIPGGITFKESDSLTGGKSLNSFETPFGRFGLGICYDMRFPEIAMRAARQGCVAMIYPGAFNTTTGPLHWELLARARAVDNQIFVAVCSPARSSDPESYQAWGHSSLVSPMGEVYSTTDESESIVFGEVDPAALAKARAGIPVTIQRRFDVYPDVSQE